MSLPAIVTAAEHSEVQAFIQNRALVTALQIAAEDVATTDHVVRKALGRLLIRGEVNLKMLALVVFTNSTLAQNVAGAGSDPVTALNNNDVDFVLASIWTTFAKAIIE